MLLQELINAVGPPFIVQFDSAQTNLEKRLSMLGVTPYLVNIGLADDKPDLFNRFRIAMQMPYGEITNWDALEESLADLSWLKIRSVNIVLAGVEVFFRRDPQSFRTLNNVLEVVGQEWANPLAEGEWWDRDAVPFHIYVGRESNMRLPFAFPNLQN